MNFKTKEVWKDIKGYETLYQVSNLGRVKSCVKERILKPRLKSHGYLMVTLYKNKSKKEFLIHRLVIETFLGPIPKGMVVNHRSEEKTDNRLENLECITQKENCNYGSSQKRKAEKTSIPLVLKNAKSNQLLRFENAKIASRYFGYTSDNAIYVLTFLSKKKGLDYINVRRKTKFYFSYGNFEV